MPSGKGRKGQTRVKRELSSSSSSEGERDGKRGSFSRQLQASESEPKRGRDAPKEKRATKRKEESTRRGSRREEGACPGAYPEDRVEPKRQREEAPEGGKRQPVGVKSEPGSSRSGDRLKQETKKDDKKPQKGVKKGGKSDGHEGQAGGRAEKERERERHGEETELRGSKKGDKMKVTTTAKATVKREKLPELLSASKLMPLDQLDILSDLQTEDTVFQEKRKREPHSHPSESVASESKSLLGLVSRKGRTSVYSGQARSTFYTHVLKLEELCLRVLMDNVDKVTYVGDAPYFLIKPVLQKCSPPQLMKIEDMNPDLVEDGDELWKDHCQREFRGKQPLDDETWKELYTRLTHERNAKLRKITKNIQGSMAKAAPVRSAIVTDVKKTSARRPASVPLATGISSGARSSMARSNPSLNGNRNNGGVPQKVKKAPLMAKTLQMMKSRFRR